MRRQEAIEVARAFLKKNVKTPWKYGLVMYSEEKNTPRLMAFYNDFTCRQAYLDAEETREGAKKRSSIDLFYAVFDKEKPKYLPQ